MASGKLMLEAFNKKLKTNSKEYHSGWGRKFGNKAQMAKKFFKRDKKIVAFDIGKQGLKTGIGLIPFPGSKEGALLLEKAGGAALKAGVKYGESELEKKGVKSLVKSKLESIGKELQAAKAALGKVDDLKLQHAKQVKEQELLHKISELERKQVKYDLVRLKDHAGKLERRHFKLKEASQKATKTLRFSNSVSSDDTPITQMSKWADYFSTLQEVEHYQSKCDDTLLEIEAVAAEARAYLDKSMAATTALRAKHEPALEQSFNNIIKTYPDVKTLDDLELKLVMMSLEESGLV